MGRFGAQSIGVSIVDERVPVTLSTEAPPYARKISSKIGLRHETRASRIIVFPEWFRRVSRDCWSMRGRNPRKETPVSRVADKQAINLEVSKLN